MDKVFWGVEYKFDPVLSFLNKIFSFILYLHLFFDIDIHWGLTCRLWSAHWSRTRKFAFADRFLRIPKGSPLRWQSLHVCSYTCTGISVFYDKQTIPVVICNMGCGKRKKTSCQTTAPLPRLLCLLGNRHRVCEGECAGTWLDAAAQLWTTGVHVGVR